MKKIINDYYSGFEGEGEIQFIHLHSNGDESVIRIWDGYFDDIMEQFEPEGNGWTGLAYYYNLCEGWNDSSPWKIPDVHDALRQFKGLRIKNMRFKESHKVLSEIFNLLTKALEQNEDVWIADE